jgi:hypothetical protein
MFGSRKIHSFRFGISGTWDESPHEGCSELQIYLTLSKDHGLGLTLSRFVPHQAFVALASYCTFNTHLVYHTNGKY